MSNAFTIKIFFRGDWCPWCNAYLRDFDSHLDKVQALGGQITAITSQLGNQSKSNNALRYDVIIDETIALAQKYDIAVTPKPDAAEAYPHGMVQPGVVIEDAASKVLYHWAIVPSEMNFGGATDRPLVADIVGSLDKILAGAAPEGFAHTDMAYLADAHPDIHQAVQEFLAKMAAKDD